MAKELKWEEIKHDRGFYLTRTPIFGGWLVQMISDVMTPVNKGFDRDVIESGVEWRSSITFVPDCDHQWDLEKTYTL